MADLLRLLVNHNFFFYIWRHALNLVYFSTVSSLKQSYLSIWNTFANLRNTWLSQNDSKWKVLNSLINGKSDKNADTLNLYFQKWKFILNKKLNWRTFFIYKCPLQHFYSHLKKSRVKSKKNILINYSLATK